MVVEDDALVALDLEMMLKAAGCEVIGPLGWLDQALSFAVKEEFDGALLDIHLRGTLVYPVADVLAIREIPFMFLSGYGYRDLPQRFSDRPIWSKPYTTKALAMKVSEVIAGSRTDRSGPGHGQP